MVHSYLVDMVLICQKEKNTQQVLDVSHVMWSELRSAVFERKCPIYGPYLMKLIEETWASTFPEEMLVTGDLVSHEVIKLRQKEHWGTPAAPEVEAHASESEGDDEPDYEPPSEEPTWAAKLKQKMKKLFCIQAQGQYKAHVAAKKARGRDKAMMRHLGMELSSGSEDKITDEEEWISKNCKWSESEEDVQPAAEEEESSDQEEW